MIREILLPGGSDFFGTVFPGRSTYCWDSVMYETLLPGGSDGGDDLPDDVPGLGQVRRRLLYLPHGLLSG